jgi:hypothetical protein
MQMDFENPSFFSISMGVGLGGKNIDFSLNDLQNKEKYNTDLYDLEDDGNSERIEFRAATVVDAEGAYFFNKYVGVGGRFRVRAMSAKSFGKYNDIATDIPNDYWEGAFYDVYAQANQKLDMAAANIGGAPITNIGGVVKSDHLAEFTASAGLYFNIPLNQRLSLGTKFLIGRSFTQELDIDGFAEGNVKNINYALYVMNGKVYEDEEGRYFVLSDPEGTGETYSTEWNYLTLGAKSSTSFGTGISLTYKYKSNFSWRLFCDYDYTKKSFELTYDPYAFMKNDLTSNAYDLLCNSLVSPYHALMDPVVYKKDKKMNYFTVGLSFLVNL